MTESTSDERVRVKICGVTSLEDARFAAGALADYLGFIFFEKSPRFIEPAQAGAIINWIEGPSCAGVFVNHALDDVNMIVRQSGIDLVQLHGTESPEYCRLMEKPVIKVFHVDSKTTAEQLSKQVEPYLPYADYLLFDTKSEAKWGGTGVTFDWTVLQKITADKPVFLSGGLNPENVLDACRRVKPWGIDLSSGVEQSPGIKDYDKLEKLFDQMRDVWELQERGQL